MSHTRELKPFLEKNKFECRPDAIDSHFKFLRLMEQFGLSRVENERSLQAQLNSMHWRVKQDNGSVIIEVNYSLHSNGNLCFLFRFRRRQEIFEESQTFRLFPLQNK